MPTKIFGDNVRVKPSLFLNHLNSIVSSSRINANRRRYRVRRIIVRAKFQFNVTLNIKEECIFTLKYVFTPIFHWCISSRMRHNATAILFLASTRYHLTYRFLMFLFLKQSYGEKENEQLLDSQHRQESLFRSAISTCRVLPLRWRLSK